MLQTRHSASRSALKDQHISKEEFDEFVDNCKKVQDLEHIAADCEDKIDLIHQDVALNVMSDPENEKKIREIF